VGFDVLTTCQPSTVWCSRERLPAAAAQPAQGSSEPVAPGIYLFILKQNFKENNIQFGYFLVSRSCSLTNSLMWNQQIITCIFHSTTFNFQQFNHTWNLINHRGFAKMKAK
jgi:hypothetical protein